MIPHRAWQLLHSQPSHLLEPVGSPSTVSAGLVGEGRGGEGGEGEGTGHGSWPGEPQPLYPRETKPILHKDSTGDLTGAQKETLLLPD